MVDTVSVEVPLAVTDAGEKVPFGSPVWREPDGVGEPAGRADPDRVVAFVPAATVVDAGETPTEKSAAEAAAGRTR